MGLTYAEGKGLKFKKHMYIYQLPDTNHVLQVCTNKFFLKCKTVQQYKPSQYCFPGVGNGWGMTKKVHPGLFCKSTCIQTQAFTKIDHTIKLRSNHYSNCTYTMPFFPQMCCSLLLKEIQIKPHSIHQNG